MPFTAPLFFITGGGANWAGWDGSKDVTYTRTGADGIVAFNYFSDVYGMLVTGNSNAGDDDLQCTLVTRSGDTVSFGAPVTHNTSSGLEAGTTGSSRGGLGRTASGELILQDAVGKFRTYYMSGASMTQSDLISNGQFVSSGIGGIRRSDGGFISYSGNVIRNSSLTDPATSTPEMAETAEALWSSPQQAKHFTEQIPGFVDDDTAIFFQVNVSNADQFKAYKYDLTGSNNARGTFTDLGFDDYNEDSSASQLAEMDRVYMTPPFETTGFNDTALQLEGDAGGGTLTMHAYQNGDTSYSTSTLAVSGIGDITEGNGCFVGPNNNVFLYAGLKGPVDGTWTIHVLKYVLPTNTLTQVTTIDAGVMTSEICGLHRFDDNYAILHYDTTKVRLLIP